MKSKNQKKLNKRIKKKRKIITETKKLETASTKMVAHPIANLTLTSKIYEILQLFLAQKQIKKGIFRGTCLIIAGINETLKIIAKDQCEIVILSCQADPLELLGSLVTRCEEKSIPYCYVRDSASLGRACGIKRPILACSVFSSTPLASGTERPMGIAGQLCELKDEVENLFYK